MVPREFPSTDGFRQCLIDDVHVVYFRGAVDVASIEASMRANAEIRRLHPRGIWSFNLARPMLALPDREVQKKASEASKAVDGYVLGVVVVLPGEGFWVSAARAFVGGVMMLSPVKHGREFASDVLAGAQNLAKRSGRDEGWARGLARAIEAWITSADRAA